MTRVRLYNTGTTRYRNDEITDGYGPIDFGPVHEDDGDEYRISQQIPDPVASALLDHSESFGEHETEDEDDDTITNVND